MPKIGEIFILFYNPFLDSTLLKNRFFPPGFVLNSGYDAPNKKAFLKKFFFLVQIFFVI